MARRRSVDRDGEWKVAKTINGVRVEFRCNSDGEFSARIAGEYITADTLKGVEAEARKLTKKTRRKLDMKATLMNVQHYTPGNHFHRKYLGIGCRDITITGIHAGTGNILFYYDDDDKKSVSQMDGYSLRDGVARRMPADEQAEFVRLYKLKKAATEALDKFETKWKIKDIEDAVKAAQAAALDDPHESEEPDADPR